MKTAVKNANLNREEEFQLLPSRINYSTFHKTEEEHKQLAKLKTAGKNKRTPQRERIGSKPTLRTGNLCIQVKPKRFPNFDVRKFHTTYYYRNVHENEVQYIISTHRGSSLNYTITIAKFSPYEDKIFSN